MKHHLLAGSLIFTMAMSSALGAGLPVMAQTGTGSLQSHLSTQAEDDYVYCYAGLSWLEYWAAEEINNAEDDSSSDTADSKGEYDKGGFDAVTRATTNHGIHRGSFQCDVTIEDSEGNLHELTGWTEENTGENKVTYALIDGKKYTYNKQKNSSGITEGKFTDEYGNSFLMKNYAVSGLKYIPVAVKTSDFDDFKTKYNVVENGSKIYGGFSEMNLKAYENTAAVTAKTYGLKMAEKQENGTYSFSTHSTEGTESGIEGEDLKTIDLTSLSPLLRENESSETETIFVGSYGELIRLDFTENYGDLGSHLQAAKWTYYGEDSSYSTPLASYGTKFAADNWMHKKLGIQLGLTESQRFSLPEGTDGTGYWSVTLSALGYKDASYQFKVEKKHLASREDKNIDTSELKALVTKIQALKKEDYTDGWENLQTELNETLELIALIESGSGTQASVNEQIVHLNDALEHLVEKKQMTENPPASSSEQTSTAPATQTAPAAQTEAASQTETASQTQPALKTVSLKKPKIRKLTAGKKKIKVKYKKVKKATGYEIQYSTSKKFAKATTVNSSKPSAQLKKLKRKTKYFVRMRAVLKKAGYADSHSKWSKVKTVKTK